MKKGGTAFKRPLLGVFLFRKEGKNMNYKDTLLMPKTEFEMRGNLPKKEPAYVQRWQDSAMYEKVVKQNEGKDTFVFHEDRKSTRLNSSHIQKSRMPSSA